MPDTPKNDAQKPSGAGVTNGAKVRAEEWLVHACDRCGTSDIEHAGQWVESGLTGKSEYLCGSCVRAMNEQAVAAYKTRSCI